MFYFQFLLVLLSHTHVINAHNHHCWLKQLTTLWIEFIHRHGFVDDNCDILLLILLLWGVCHSRSCCVYHNSRSHTIHPHCEIIILNNLSRYTVIYLFNMANMHVNSYRNLFCIDLDKKIHIGTKWDKSGTF